MSVESNGHRVAVRTCPLCEATCGLELTLDGDAVVSIRGDRDDVFSRGFICPKGAALKELHGDPDRLRTPLVRRADGSFEPASWDRAFELIAERLAPILAVDRNAVAVYLGNPNAHNLDNMLYGRVLLRALQTRNLYSASTVDQYPKQIASALMFGTGTTVPVPDVDRTDHLLILGANPLASNGSLMTAPDMRGRLRALRARGGKLVVIDPRRSRTATEADEHHFIRPGTDAHLLFAIAHVLFEEGLADPGERLASFTTGIDGVRSLSEPFSPEAVAPVCGIDAAALEAAPHGIDLGPLQARLPDALRTPSGMIELAPERIVADVERLRASLEAPPRNGELVLIGRRLLRSNNSWMHNLPMLVSGKPACSLHVHPDDAGRLELVDGEDARVSSRTGELVAKVEVTDAVMPGVVSLPHGWGHNVPGTAQGVASVQPGPNSNVVADELLLDVPSGNAVLNGTPVEVAPVRAPVAV